MLRLITYCALCLPLGSALAAPSMTVSQGVATARTSRYEARIQGGSIVYFRDIATGEVLVQGKAGTPLVRFIEKNRPVTATASGLDSFSARRLGNDAVEFLGTVRHGASSAKVRVVVRALDDELLLTGDATAESLGVPVASTMRLAALGAALVVGGGTAVAGGVGFVGLIVPNLVRFGAGERPGALLLPSLFAGAALVLVADIVVRLVPLQQELRLGVLTALIGAPLLLHLALRHGRVA